MINVKEILMSVCIAGKDVHQELNFGALLEPKLRKVFYETYDELPEQYSKIFHVLDSKKAKETDYGLGAMTPWAEFGSATSAVTGTTEMPTVPYEVIPAGLERTYTHKEFVKGFVVERKFIDDEMYSVIEKMPKDLARAGRYKVETDGASILNNAFKVCTLANDGFNSYDGVALISDAHPLLNKIVDVGFGAGKASNRVYGALSQDTLEKATLLGRKQVDEAGKKIQYKFDKLIVPPALEMKAMELLNSILKPDGELNNTNAMKGRYTIEVLDFLTSDTAWFLMDTKRHQMNFFWRKRVEFKREEEFKTYAHYYKGYMRYSFGYSDFRGIIGSDGVTPKPAGSQFSLQNEGEITPMSNEELDNANVAELKEQCKLKGLTGYSTLTKQELVELLKA